MQRNYHFCNFNGLTHDREKYPADYYYSILGCCECNATETMETSETRRIFAKQIHTSLSNREFILLRHIVDDTFHVGFKCCRRHHHCRHRRFFFSRFTSIVCFLCRNCNGDRATFYMNVSSKSSFAMGKNVFFFFHSLELYGRYVWMRLRFECATHQSLVYSQIGIKMNE